VANRYWVGGTATWDATAGTKWALTDGGAGGQAVPTSADTVFFTALSGANTVTLGVNPTVLTLTMTGFTGTLAFGTQNISLAGNAATIFTAATTATYSGTPVINATYSGATGTRTITLGALTEANSISVNITAGADIVSNSGSHRNLIFTGFSGTISNVARTIYGNLTVSTGATVTAGANAQTFSATSGTKTITSNAKTFDFPVTFNGVGGTFQLQDALTVGATRTVTLTNGTLDLNNNNLTCGFFLANNTNVRTLAFGTGQFYLTGSATSIWRTDDVTNMTFTGTDPTINATYSGATGTRTIINANTGGTYTKAVNLNVTAGTDIIAGAAQTPWFKNVDFTGYSGAAAFGAYITGNLKYSSTMTNSTTTTTTLINTSGTQQITTNAVTHDAPLAIGYGIATTAASGDGTTATLTFLTTTNFIFPVGASITVTGVTPVGYNGTYTVTASTLTSVSYLNATTGAQTVAGRVNTGSATIQLQDALTVGVTRTLTLVSGTIALNTFNLSTGLFSSSFATTRTITFGTANITTTGSGGVWNLTAATGFTYTGTPTVNISNNSATASSITMSGATAATALNFNITIGTYALTINTTAVFDDLNFTGFTGTWAPTTQTITFYGSLTMVSGMTFTAGTGAFTFAATSGTQVITSAAKTLNPITQNGVGGTVQLADALTTTSTATYTLTNGALNLNNFNLTAGLFSSSNTNIRSIAFGTAAIYITANNTTVWSMATNGNFTPTGTKIVNLTYSGATGTRNIRHGSTAGATSSSLSFNVTAGTDTITLAGIVNGIDLTGFTGAFQIAGQTDTYQNVDLSSASSVSAISTGQQLIFRGGTNITFKPPNSLMGLGLWLNKSPGTATLTLLADCLTDQGIVITLGQFIAGTYNVQANDIDVGFSATVRGISMGSGTWTLTPSVSSAAWVYGTGGTYTFNAGTANIVIDSPSSVDVIFAGGPYSYNKLTFQNGLSLYISGSSTFTELASTATTAWTLTLQASTTTTVGAFTIDGSAGNLVSLRSSIAGTQATLSKASGIVSVDYLDIQDSNAAGGATWYAGTNSVDNGNNTGWFFSGPGILGSITESFTMADAISAILTFASSITEPLTSAETETAQLNFNSAITEPTTAAESESVQANFNSIRTEPLTSAETETSQANFNSARTEPFTIADSSSTVYLISVSITEALTSAEVESVFNVLASSTTEAITVANVQSAISVFSAARVEPLTSANTQTAQATFNPSQTEPVVSADTNNADRNTSGSVVESITSAEVDLAQVNFNSSRVEPLTSAETETAQVAFNSSIVEPVTLANTQSVSAIFAVSRSENSTLADIQSAIQAFLSSIVETLTLADITASIKVVSATNTEASTLLSIQSTATVFNVNRVEPVTMADAESVLRALFADRTEPLTSAEAESAQSTFIANTTEPTTLAETEAGQASFNRSVTEPSTLADANNALKTLISAITEAMSNGDISSASSIFVATLTESFTAADFIAVQASFNAFLTENLVLSDLPIGRGWFRVVDDQTVVWSAVNNGQTVTWQNIGNDQNPNWQRIDNTQE
jgi:hypothetical protein